jgi:hypothetical protein
MKKYLYFLCVFMGTCIFPCLFTKKILKLWLIKSGTEMEQIGLQDN